MDANQQANQASVARNLERARSTPAATTADGAQVSTLGAIGNVLGNSLLGSNESAARVEGHISRLIPGASASTDAG